MFLALMIATFTTTANLFDKNRERHHAFENAARPWLFEDEFFENYGAKRNLSTDLNSLE